MAEAEGFTERIVIRSPEGDHELLARKAELSDCRAIAETASLVSFGAYGKFDRGFLVYAYSADEYRAQMEAGYPASVLELEGRIIGYATCLTQDHIKRAAACSLASPCSAATIVRYSETHSLTKYLLVDQLAILPEFQDRGFGELFCAALIKQYQVTAFAEFLEAPVANPRIEFWKSRGFEKIDEVVEPAPEGFPHDAPTLTWGVYVLRRGSFAAKHSA